MNKVVLLIIIGLLNMAFHSNALAQSKWSFAEETQISGTISGTISNGFLFETTNSQFYIVIDYSIQVVVTVYPEVRIFKKGDEYKLVIDDFDEPVICKKLNNVIKTKIYDEFNGWDGETIFKMMNGQIWQQASYSYMYHYAYRPDVLIYEFNNQKYMKVDGVNESITVELLSTNGNKNTNEFIETSIDGEFNGWEGETVFKMMNGQIWQQNSFDYHYHYSYSPKVFIYKVSKGYEMKVEGVQKNIRVIRLK